MQQVTAFSRPQTVPSVPATVPKSNPWILSSWRDLILYVGTPLLLVPMFALAQARWSAQDIYIFVAAFGAMGHHLPGMIRAYGDRALFERFRARFIFAPIFLATVCVGFYWYDLKAIVLIVFLWGVWHGMMQTYGFCRIYDAKMGSFAALSRRLDFATCGLWFAAAVVLSPTRMGDALGALYAGGLPFVSPGLLHGAQAVLLTCAIAAAILCLGNFFWMWSRGQRQNPVKIALLITSISFWWYCNNGVTNILAGIALFEVFHDVQYLSLVWIYNRNRVEKDNTIGGFMRFVFRRSGALVGLYIGLIFAYGSLAYLNSHIGIETVRKILTGVVAASGLLHFYYDGFIWKMREKSTRQSLGLAGGTADISQNKLVPGWALHGAKWAIAFVLPLAALWIGQMRGSTSELDRYAWLVTDLPAGAPQHYDYGAVLQKNGRLDEAEKEYRTTLQLDPDYASAHTNLAGVLIKKSKFDEARTHYEASLRLEPNDGELRSGYAYLLERLGEKTQAEEEYQKAIRLSARSPRIPYTYGMFLEKNGRIDEAMTQYRSALQADSRFADAHYNLACALFTKGELDQAKTHFLEAVQIAPGRADVHNDLGSVLLKQGQMTQAVIQFEEALRLDPKCKPAEENLRIARASDNRFRSRP